MTRSNSTENQPSQDTIRIAGKDMSKADLFKFLGLVSFFILMGVLFVLLWPLFKDLFQPGGVNRVIEQLRDAGVFGVGILLLLQFLQIVVAFIPGEVTQVAAGMLYGPFWGSLIILTGCVISSAFIYELVHRLGAPFVRAFVPEKQIAHIEKMEEGGRLNVLVFILFLIPGLPKDAFTYIVPLTSMPLREFLLLTTIGRTPGVVLSAYAASGFLNGNMGVSIAIFVVFGLVAVLGILFKERILKALNQKRSADK